MDTSAIYRGRVSEIENDILRVEQVLPGFDYRQPAIRFHLGDETVFLPEGARPAVGAFVEVVYSGMLTRSIPAQGQAKSVRFISPLADTAIINGTITSVSLGEGTYRLGIRSLAPTPTPDAAPFEAILIVPATALENIPPEALVEGQTVSAITTGIAALSMPPQLPVHALLPYTSPLGDF